MKKNNSKIYAVLAGTLLPLLVLAQANTPTQPPQEQTATTTAPQPATIDDAIKFRKEILEAFGLPADTPTSIFDLLKGNPAGIRAQIPGTPLSDLRLVPSTKNFEPESTVQVAAISFTADLQKSTLRWYVNGSLVLSGKGQTLYTIKAGPLGSVYSIRIAVTSDTGAIKEVTKTIRVGRIHLIWETKSYTPPWYRGKALPDPGSEITIMAVPEFKSGGIFLNSSELIYNWFIDNEAPVLDPAISGRGKNTYTLKTTSVIGSTYTIGVQIKDDQQRFEQEKNIDIILYQPEILLYEKDPVFGIKMEKASRAWFLRGGGEITLQTEPYYVPLNDFKNMNYTWKVNGKTTPNSYGNGRTFRLTTDPATYGKQIIDISYGSIANILRQGSVRATINVGGIQP